MRIRNMKFVTWHSSDGKLGDDDVVPAFLEPKRSRHGLCSNIGKRSGDVLLILLCA
jgi:hypothetical protein